jgi:transposase
MRQVGFLDTEIAEAERLIEALSRPEVKRLMTLPGVNVIVAATLMAAVGDIRRFTARTPSPRARRAARRQSRAGVGSDASVQRSAFGGPVLPAATAPGPTDRRRTLRSAP